jgi:hypothetical protein
METCADAQDYCLMRNTLPNKSLASGLNITFTYSTYTKLKIEFKYLEQSERIEITFLELST